MASSSTLLGAAGEHFVMSQLLRRGYIAALAPHGVPNTDIVVSNIRGSRLCSIQVKTRRSLGSDGGWHMQEKHERIREDRLFYCFVDVGTTLVSQPTVHVIPSAVVATILKESHQLWLALPGRNGRAHKDGPMRRFLPDYERVFGKANNAYQSGWLDPYLNAWHLLKLDGSDLSTTKGL
jgi:hypothetical protein